MPYPRSFSAKVSRHLCRSAFRGFRRFPCFDYRHLHISQEEIANLSGVSRQRCNSVLNWLKEAGYVRIEYGGITMLDLDGLRSKVNLKRLC